MICCRFLPHQGVLLEILDVFLFTGFFVFCLIAETTGRLFPALETGFLVGGTAALFLSLFLWIGPHLLSLKWERLLLQWVDAYLRLRQLEGILLPDLAVQEENWKDLPEDFSGMEYWRSRTFRSPMPLEALPAAMKAWLESENRREHGRTWISVQWKGTRFILFRKDYHNRRDANPFYGKVEPAGKGGCLLRGGFFLPPVKAGVLLLGLALCIVLFGWLVAVRSPQPFFNAVLLCAAGGCLKKLIVYHPLENTGSQAILTFLSAHFEEIEG